ncbi:hypothetical protein QQZ08_010080 [Neonectria magnoliae]|uniref:Uncharacterized protein n=1 Tax=Neonectria magnoliae TaxID=2732573 RepID=A0ABR1HIX0_9HYPO
MVDKADNLGSSTSRGHSPKRNWAEWGPDFHQPDLYDHDSHGRHEFTNATTAPRPHVHHALSPFSTSEHGTSEALPATLPSLCPEPDSLVANHSAPSMSKPLPQPKPGNSTLAKLERMAQLSRRRRPESPTTVQEGSEATHAKGPPAQSSSALSTKQTDVAPERPRVKVTHSIPDESITDKSTKVDGQAKISLLVSLWWLVKLPFSFVFGLVKGTLSVSQTILPRHQLMYESCEFYVHFFVNFDRW